MPIVPLIRNRPIADAASPVLDNLRRPTIDNREVSAAVGNLADSQKMPLVPDSLAAPYEAMGAVGRALQETGDAVSANALKVDEATTISQVADVQVEREADDADFEIWKRANDPSLWEPERIKRNDAFQKRIQENKLLTPRTKAKLAEVYPRTATRSVVATRLSADKEIYGRATSALRAQAMRAIENQEEGGLDIVISQAEGGGYWHDYESEHFRQQFKRVGEQKEKEAKANEFDAAQNAVIITTRAQGADAANEVIDSGSFGKLDEADRERLRHTAQQVGNARSAETLGSVAEAISSGAIKSTADVDAYPQSAFFTPQLREQAKGMVIRRDALAEKIERDTNGVRNAVRLRQEVADYDPVTDPKREKYFELVHSIGSSVEQTMAGEITGELYKKYGLPKPPELKVRPEIMQGFSKSLDLLFDPAKGVIPWKDTLPALDASGKPVKDKSGNPVMRDDLAAKQRSLDAQTIVEMRFNDWAKQNPQDAQSYEKAKAKWTELLPEGTRSGALDVLKKTLPVRPASADIRSYQDAPDLAAKLPAGLRSHADDFIEAAREYGLNPRFLAAISALETGGGTSKAFREKRNAMGVSDKSGPREMESVRESIFYMARVLASNSGPYARAKTIDDIGAIYAPVGAENDFRGTNAGWSEGVKRYLSTL